jgi:DNA-binding LacI/PurR family transcriptional regulator
MKLKNFLLLTISISFVPTPAIAQSPALAWSWQQSNIGNRQCVRRATTVLAQAGFRNIGTVGKSSDTSIYATNGDYTGVIRCITRQRMIVFLVTGSQAKLTSELETRLSQSF